MVVRQSKADTALVSQLQRIGTNLNQMARVVHQTGGMVPRIAKRRQSFKGAGLYYLHDKGAMTAERVTWTPYPEPSDE